MKRLLYAFIVAIFVASFSFSQVTLNPSVANTIPVQTVFAVITPISGTGQGLSVSETFGEQFGGNLFQSSVLPSPLVTLTSVVVNLDSKSGSNTGVALVNPNAIPASVSLSLMNQQGINIGTRTLTVGPRQQVSRFVTELFGGLPEMAAPLTGLLFLSSTEPVGVLGLAFNGPSFVSLPVATQLSVNSVANVNNTGGFQGPTTSIVVPQTFTFSNGVTPSLVPSTMMPLPSNITGLPPVQPITGITAPLVTATGQLTSTTSPAAASVNAVSPAPTFPQIGTGAGGNGAVLLPQIALGGGWVSQITIANTSTTAQTVRVDFFNPAGGPLMLPAGSSIPSVVIPAGGVVTLSTAL